MEDKASPPPSASKKRKSLSPDGKSAAPSPYRLVRRRRGSTGSLPSAVGVSEMQGAADLPCDTMVALQVLRSQFPSVERSKIRVPIMLKSQLLAVLQDPTNAERELDQMKREIKIRMFKLQNRRNEYAIMLQEDYLTQVENVRRKMVKEKESADKVFQIFIDKVLPACISDELHYSLTKEKLTELLSVDGELEEDPITVLINAGLFIHGRTEDHNYWFSIPNAGSFLKACMKGREEVLRILNRNKHKEMLQEEVEKKKMRSSFLGPLFHIRDLTGLGLIETIPTSAGPLLRVVMAK